MNKFHVSSRSLGAKYRLPLVGLDLLPVLRSRRIPTVFGRFCVYSVFSLVDSGGMPDRSVTLTGLPESIQ